MRSAWLKASLLLSIVVAIAFFAGKSWPQQPPGGAPGSPSDKPSLSPTVDSATGNELLLHGMVTVHPDLRAFAPAGGSLHIRIVDLGLRRPCMFVKLEKIAFPVRYEFRARDAVSNIGLEAVRRDNFYVEAFYAPPGAKLHVNRDRQVGGEAWGRMGKPSSLRVGDRADITLSSFWTPELFSGGLTRQKGAVFEGWVYPIEALRPRVSSHNRLTVVMIKAPVVPGRPDEHPTVLAAKVYRDVDPARPLAVHINKEDFRVHPIDKNWRAYYLARLENFAPNRTITSYLWGGRASPKVVIGVKVRGLKIALVEELGRDPLVSLGLDMTTIHVSDATYDWVY